VRLRFVGQAGKASTSFVGLDNIQFTENCIRLNRADVVDLLSTDGNMTYPYPEPILSCAYINVQKPEFWTTQHIVAVAVGGGLGLCICIGVIELVWMVREHRKKVAAHIAKRHARQAVTGKDMSTMARPTLQKAGAVHHFNAVSHTPSVLDAIKGTLHKPIFSLKGGKYKPVQHGNKASIKRRSLKDKNDTAVEHGNNGHTHPHVHLPPGTTSWLDYIRKFVPLNNVTMKGQMEDLKYFSEESGLMDRFEKIAIVLHFKKPKVVAQPNLVISRSPKVEKEKSVLIEKDDEHKQNSPAPTDINLQEQEPVLNPIDSL